jgi:hypothetical protein
MLVVIGGHSRNVGKTSTAAAIVRATRHRRWTAVKISAHRHGGGADSFQLMEEHSSGDSSDSARLLAAGAARSYWLRASDQQLPAAMPSLMELCRSSPNVVIESNRVMAYLKPDLYLQVLDCRVEDFKESARHFFERADAYLVVHASEQTPHWPDVPVTQMMRRPVFELSPPGYESAELVDLIEARGRRQQPTSLSAKGSPQSALQNPSNALYHWPGGCRSSRHDFHLPEHALGK